MSDLPPDHRPRALPAHPERDDARHAEGRGTTVNWAKVMVLALIAVLVLVIVILHLTGVVGPTGHG